MSGHKGESNCRDAVQAPVEDAQKCTELKHQNFSRSTNRMGVALMRESTSSSAVCAGDVLCDGAVVPFKWCGCFSVAALFCSQGHVLYCTHSAAHEKCSV